MTVGVVPRDVWCPVPPEGRPAGIVTPTPRLWLHHGATGVSDRKTAIAYAKYHIRTHGWVMEGYSFLIAGGEVLEGRGEGKAGAHTQGDNDRSHGICMVGNYQSRLPSTADIDALVWLVRHGMDRGWWDGPITGGHRDAPGASTSCPGRRLWKHIPDINRQVADVDEGLDMDAAELRQIVREEVAAAFDGRDYNNDMGRVRRSLRAMAAHLGMATELPVDPGFQVDA